MKNISVRVLVYIVLTGFVPGLSNVLFESDFITNSSAMGLSVQPMNNSTEAAASVDDMYDERLRFQVDAGAYDRQGTIVSVQLPVAIESGVYPLSDRQGKVQALQVDDTNRGWFILDKLPAGESAVFILDLQSLNSAGRKFADDRKGVIIQKESATIDFSNNNGKVLSYYHSENNPPEELNEMYRRGGYIHPLYSPSGVVLTSHLNTDQHPHHSGIWSAWTNTVFEGRNPDFWNVHGETGRVDVDSLLSSWDGPVTGGFRSAHRFTDLSADEPMVALNETWEVHVYASSYYENVNILDLKVTQTVNTDKPLHLPEYRYGGIGFRGHIDWNDYEKAFFLTSGGLGRDGHATRGRWAHMGGYSEGQLAGFAILDHPSNFRFPQTMRIHPKEPFFNYAPAQLGDMSIQPGLPHVTRFRVITHDGEPDPELIDRLWQDYAYPPGVTVTN